MNEDNTPLSQGGGRDASMADSAESEQASAKVFDITEDSISPIEDVTEKLHEPASVIAQKPLPPKTDLTKKPAQNPSGYKPYSPPIPLQDFSSSLDKARTVQANITPVSEIGKKYEKEIAKEKQPETPTIKQLRTYESDVAEVLSRKRASTASIAIAENKKNEGEESLGNKEPSHAGKKLLLTLSSLILIGAGAIGAYYLYSISALAPVTLVTSAPKAAQPLVPAETNAVIFVDNQNNIQIQSLIQKEIDKPQEPNTIKEIIPAKNVNSQVVRVSGPELLQLMDIDPPDNLSRSLTEQSMIGVYADSQGQKSLFVVATTNFFQNAFAGMLQWESVMADDLKQYLYPSNGPYGIANAPASTQPQIDSVGTTTVPASADSTSTPISIPAIQPYFTIRGQFEDRIVRNKDVRAFKTTDGHTLFIYSFIDTKRIVMAGNESVLSEILSRLEKQVFIR